MNDRKHFKILLREHEKRTDLKFDEMDRRYEQRFQGQEKALEKAETQNEKKVEKAEAASEKRFESVNEFRAALSDQTNTFIPRSEAEQRTNNNAEKIADLSSRIDRFEGRSSGFSSGWLIIGQVVGLFAALIAIYFALKK